jgi:hypothetical protein
MIKQFWLLLSLGCIGWYLAVLGFVAVKGGSDIKEMLKNLSASSSNDQSEDEEET